MQEPLHSQNDIYIQNYNNLSFKHISFNTTTTSIRRPQQTYILCR